MISCGNKRILPNGTLIRVPAWRESTFFCVVLSSWMINSSRRLYKLIHQDGRVFESYESEFWDVIS